MTRAILFLAFLLPACALVEPPFGDDPPVKDGDLFYTNWACLGYEPIPALSLSLEKQERWTRPAAQYFFSGQCRRFNVQVFPVHDYIDWFEDWEGDEAYIVQFEGGDFYGIVWEHNRYGKQT